MNRETFRRLEAYKLEHTDPSHDRENVYRVLNGALGVARTLIYGAQHGEPIYTRREDGSLLTAPPKRIRNLSAASTISN